jgi:hypothetical protein
MPLAVILGTGALVGLPLLRVLAARRLAKGDTSLIWFLFPIHFLSGLVLVAIALTMLARQPVEALLAGALGLFFLVLATRLVLRLRKAIQAAPYPPDIGAIVADVAPDYVVALVGLGLLIGIVGGILLVILAATHSL